MASQPFTMQTPEYIAKFYGGDKQKIFKALQSGALKSFAPAPFDQTLAAAAADFIEQVRAAAQTEQAPQQTVFEKLFAPPAPQQPPAGLGATPQAAPMPPQEMGPPPQQMAPPPQEMAPPPQEMPAMADDGMVPSYAGGGLSDLPVPDAMFDEPDNGSYAGGGMVAFAPGGSTGDLIEQTALSKFPDLQITGRARTEARNAEVDGVPDSFHRIDAARDVRVPPGMTKSEFISQLKGTFGADYDILPSKGNSVHIEPGPALGRKVRGGKELASAAQKPNTLYGMPTDLQGNFDMINRMMPAQSEEDIEYSKELAESLSPESRAQSKKDAFYEGLGKFAARLGNAKDKSLLGGLAETLGAGAGDIAESLNEDKKRIREMQRERSQIANATRKEKIEALQMGVNLNVKAADLAEGIEARKEEVAYKRAILDIERAKVGNQVAQILAESKSKENTKERFIETFYNVLIRKGYSENQARQFAYYAAERQLAQLKAQYGGTGGMEGLFDRGDGGSSGGQTANTFDYDSLKD